MIDSIIVGVPGEKIVPLRESFLALTDGKKKPAYLLSILEYWTMQEYQQNKIRRRLNREAKQKGEAPPHDVNESLWVQRKVDELAQDSMGILTHASEVSRVAKWLEQRNLIETDQPYKNEGRMDKCYRLKINVINSALRDMAEDHESIEQRIEKTAQEEKKRRKEEAEDRYTPDQWEYKYAKRWWQIMDGLGGGRINKDWRERREDILQNWADAFHWCTNTRDLERSDVDLILKWLFTQDSNWWVDNQAIIAPTKFRERNKQDEYRIHEFLRDARQWKDKKSNPGKYSKYGLPEHKDEVLEWKRDKILEEMGEQYADCFKSIGYGEGRDSDQKRYRFYHPDHMQESNSQ